MKQPDLGKKIAELRQAKGLTQVELAEKCNLSARTIQRIESAEVSPRSYTVKLIFNCLEYDIYNSFGKFTYGLDRVAYKFQLWPGQFYRYVLDLFNLKTNTMKKLFILSVPFLTLSLILLFSCSLHVKAQNKMQIRARLMDASSNSTFMHYFNSGKIDSLGLTYQENACMMPDAYPAVFNRKDIVIYWEQLYDRGVRFLDVKTQAMVVSDTIAIDRGTWTVGIDTAFSVTGTYLTQWHYRNGEWKIENEMSKSDMNLK